jgi:predicted MPP superfamily phosphohydrolase
MARAGRRLITGRRLVLAVLLVIVLLVAKAWHDTLADPVVHRDSVTLPGLAADTTPITVLLMSDLHVAGPDMPPERLERIVAQANAMKPDIVAIAGDLISDKRLSSKRYEYDEALAPLGKLQPAMGTVAVLGNHDHWRDAAEARQVLQANGVIVLANEATRIGPLAIGGLDDDFTGHADVGRTHAAMLAIGGPMVALSHSPDPFPDLPQDISLMLAGHTHCGQVRLPLVGALSSVSRYGTRFECGRIDEGNQTVFVGAGLGTSVLPFRFGTQPDMWLITIRPPDRAEAEGRPNGPAIAGES